MCKKISSDFLGGAKVLYFTCHLVTVYASAIIEEAFNSALGATDTVRIGASECRIESAAYTLVLDALRLKKHEYQSHSDISAVHRLVKVVGSRVVVHVNVYFINSGKRMKNREVLFCNSKLIAS